MGFFDKAKEYEALTDPFDEKLMVSIGNSSMSLFMWKKEIREKIKECSDILNEIKNNPLFKKVEELLKENLVVIEKQNLAILENQKRIESQVVQINNYEVKLKELNDKFCYFLNEINNKTTICLIDLDKKTNEIKSIAVQDVLNNFNKNLENFRKEQEEKYLKDLVEVKRKVSEHINKNVNDAIVNAVNQVYQIANDKLKEAVSNSGYGKAQGNETQKDETENSTVEDDEEFTRPE
jgi:predicted ATP-dependent endonuclease of OLD family